MEKKGVDQTLMEDIHTEIMYLNLGPSHPATHGAIRILTALDGETILANVNEIGYLHRGFEKTAENRTYNQVIPLTDRLNYCSALMNKYSSGPCFMTECQSAKLPDALVSRRKLLTTESGSFYQRLKRLLIYENNLAHTINFFPYTSED